MSGGAGYYQITNNQVGDIDFLNSDGNNVSISPASSGAYYITASTWSSLVALLGASHVVAIVTNPTYRYAVLGFAPYLTSTTDILVIQGSSTKTVNITKIRMSGLTTVTAGTMPYNIIRRSTAGTLGSAVLTAITASQIDINTAAPTATVSTVGTANYGTLGTSAGLIEVGRIPLGLAGTLYPGGDGMANVFRYGDSNDQPIKLRGTSDFVCINLGGTAPSGTAPVLDIMIETYEDLS